MSVIGDIVDAIIVDVKAAVSGIHTETENFSLSRLTHRDLPHCGVVATLYTAEALDFRQELQTWEIELQLVQSGGTREDLEVKIEAIRTEIFADPTLGGKVDRAFMLSSVPHSQAGSPQLVGTIVVTATKVKS